jgi:hypothetical protein
MEAADGSWKYEAIQEFKAGLTGPNSIRAEKEGGVVISLDDGTQYLVDGGYLSITNIIMGKINLLIAGKYVIKDLTHDITAEIIMDPDRQEGYISSFAKKLKFWGSKKTKRPADHCDINIYEGDVDPSNLVCQGKGSYLESIEFEGETYWQMGEEWGEWNKTIDPMLLASDTSTRPDLNMVAAKDYDNAQVAKEELEVNQRKDRQLRMDGLKK